MRILFVSASPIKKEISIGNTFLNLFEGMDDVELASVCARGGIPDAPVAHCFCSTEVMQIRNMLRGTPAGRVVDLTESWKSQRPSDSPKRLYERKFYLRVGT